MPFPFPTAVVSGAQVPQRLRALLGEGEHAGFTPVVLGNRRSEELIEETGKLNGETIEAALKRFATREDDYEEVLKRLFLGDREELDEDPSEEEDFVGYHARPDDVPDASAQPPSAAYYESALEALRNLGAAPTDEGKASKANSTSVSQEERGFLEQILERKIATMKSRPAAEREIEVSELAGLSAHLDIQSRKPLPEVLIASIPARPPWLAPIYLRFGGWNACPDPVDHAILFKYWAEKYGTTIIAITSDTIECHVARPPTTKEAALALAREQYAYCSDIVDQGTETIPNLAQGLLNSNHWYFWWD